MGQESRDWQTMALGPDASPPPVCANKVLLEHSPTCFLIAVTTLELGSSNRALMVIKPEKFY